MSKEQRNYNDNFVEDLMKERVQLKQQLAESESESNARYSAWQEEIGECDRLRVALAEKDQAIESLQEINQSLGQTCNNDAKEIERLREQLAEKEKEYNAKCIYEAKFRKTLGNWQNQTAIDELEKVKDFMLGSLNVEECVEYADQQIKLLKGEK